MAQASAARKPTREEIRRRSHPQVERFCNAETGQAAGADSPAAPDRIAHAAARIPPPSPVWPIDLPRETGFAPVGIARQNGCFAAHRAGKG